MRYKCFALKILNRLKFRGWCQQMLMTWKQTQADWWDSQSCQKNFQKKSCQIEVWNIFKNDFDDYGGQSGRWATFDRFNSRRWAGLYFDFSKKSCQIVVLNYCEININSILNHLTAWKEYCWLPKSSQETFQDSHCNQPHQMLNRIWAIFVSVSLIYKKFNTYLIHTFLFIW